MMSNECPEDAAAREKRAEELLKSVEHVVSGDAERPKNMRDAVNEMMAEGVGRLRKIPLKKHPTRD